MSGTHDSDAPRVHREGDRVFIDVARGDAEELQVHLRSLGVGTAVLGESGDESARLEVLDHGPQDVEAVLSQWEVARS